MKLQLLSLVFLILELLGKSLAAQVTALDRKFLPLLHMSREMMLDFARPKDFEATYKFNLMRGKIQTPFDDSLPFFCDVNGPGARSKVPPNSVHKLTPGDIDIVGAIGDSLTAANGVWSAGDDPFRVFIEGKGVSFSIGGQGTWRRFMTIPNILKEFNPNLYGYSEQDALSYQREAKFNVAEPGAMTSDVFLQAQNLLLRMKSDPNVDFKHHWKLITLLVGGNDFCLDICYYEDQDRLVQKAEHDLMITLRFLRDNFPRTMVNVAVPPDVVSLLLTMRGKPQECIVTHYFECPCVFSLNHQMTIRRTMKTIRKWMKRVEDVANNPEFQDRSDFTVNLAPFVDRLELMMDNNGNTDLTYFSYDCFHLSQKGNAIAANALWNNMLEPVGNKTRNWQKEFALMKCPTVERPYLSTNRNSFY